MKVTTLLGQYKSDLTVNWTEESKSHSAVTLSGNLLTLSANISIEYNSTNDIEIYSTHTHSSSGGVVKQAYYYAYYGGGGGGNGGGSDSGSGMQPYGSPTYFYSSYESTTTTKGKDHYASKSNSSITYSLISGLFVSGNSSWANDGFAKINMFCKYNGQTGQTGTLLNETWNDGDSEIWDQPEFMMR